MAAIIGGADHFSKQNGEENNIYFFSTHIINPGGFKI